MTNAGPPSRCILSSLSQINLSEYTSAGLSPSLCIFPNLYHFLAPFLPICAGLSLMLCNLPFGKIHCLSYVVVSCTRMNRAIATSACVRDQRPIAGTASIDIHACGAVSAISSNISKGSTEDITESSAEGGSILAMMCVIQFSRLNKKYIFVRVPSATCDHVLTRCTSVAERM